MSGLSTASAPVDIDPAEKRTHVRWTFRGTPFPVRIGKKEFEIRLKDLSRGGACGLMEEPVAIGDYLLITFDRSHVVEAQVCWVRRVMVGLRFSNILPATFVAKVHERAAEQRAEADGADYLLPRTRPASERTVKSG